MPDDIEHPLEEGTKVLYDPVVDSRPHREGVVEEVDCQREPISYLIHDIGDDTFVSTYESSIISVEGKPEGGRDV